VIILQYCQRAYHREDKRKEVGRYRVEVAAELDTIRLAVFKKRALENVNNDAMFTKACNTLLVLRLGPYGCGNEVIAYLMMKGVIA
jgi:hypothetical protein